MKNASKLTLLVGLGAVAAMGLVGCGNKEAEDTTVVSNKVVTNKVVSNDATGNTVSNSTTTTSNAAVPAPKTQ